MEKNRDKLKTYFQKGKIPTEANFKELIDNSINQVDDGISKPATDPLRINATGTDKTLLDFYDAQIGKVAWALTLTGTGKDQQGPSSGWSVTAAEGGSRLFIDGKGCVGIGTASPGAWLDVGGLVQLGSVPDSPAQRIIWFKRDTQSVDDDKAGSIAYKVQGLDENALSIVGAGKTPHKIRMYNDVFIEGNLSVKGRMRDIRNPHVRQYNKPVRIQRAANVDFTTVDWVEMTWKPGDSNVIVVDADADGKALALFQAGGVQAKKLKTNDIEEPNDYKEPILARVRFKLMVGYGTNPPDSFARSMHEFRFHGWDLRNVTLQAIVPLKVGKNSFKVEWAVNSYKEEAVQATACWEDDTRHLIVIEI